METYNIHNGETQLSRLVEKAANGQPFLIAKAGKPIAKVVPLEHEEQRAIKPIGFLKGRITVPDDFDRMGGAEVERLFEGKA
ncbi:MAG: type II toxin-antitoxin system prevent-host-death family antitoxin [Hyphomicrobiales bacterium]|nr:type II toxin-antitoxin system prevent-host-death family antitoxin [Hyphomicrobiales bacterium]MBV8664160.1 type II toxin-antitoxin system prevent-host-death family antitoxin [Hyphomicrobiales bacterium]